MADLVVKISASIEELKSSLTNAEKQLKSFGDKATSIGQTLSLALTAPISIFGTLAVRTFGDFEASLNKVQAVTNATGSEFEALSAKARELGATTQFSASQAADAINFLGIAGFDTTKILGSLDDTLKLSAASGLDLGRSADIVSNVLTGFRLETTELERAVDVLSRSFTTSNTDLNQLSEALKFAAPVASSFGVSIEESVAAIGALSNAGLQGSIAGTGLRRVFSALAKESDKLGIVTTTSTGKLRNFADIIEDLEKRGLTAAEALQVFGDRGGPAILTLLETGSKALRNYTADLENSGGTAERLAEVQLRGLNGSLRILKSTFEELQLRISESGFAGVVEKLIGKVTALIRSFSNLSDTTLSIIVAVAAVVAAIGPLLLAIGTFSKVTSVALSAIPLLVSAFSALGTAVTFATGPIGIAIALTAALAFGINKLVKEVNLSEKTLSIQKTALDELKKGTELAAEAQDLLNKANRDYGIVSEKATLQTKELIKAKIEDVRASIAQAKAVTDLAVAEASRTTTVDKLQKIFLPGYFGQQKRVNAVQKESAEQIANLNKILNELTISYFNIGKTVTQVGEATKQAFEEFSKLADIANAKVFAQFDAEAEEYNKTLQETINLSRRIAAAKFDGLQLTANFDEFGNLIQGTQKKIDLLGTVKIVEVDVQLGKKPPVEEVADQIIDLGKVLKTTAIEAVGFNPFSVLVDSVNRFKELSAEIAATTDIESKLGLIKEQALILGDSFGALGDIIGNAFAGANQRLKGFISAFANFAGQIIAQAFAISKAKAIEGASITGASTGPLAAFATPGIIASALAVVASAFRGIGGGRSVSGVGSGGGGGSFARGGQGQTFAGSQTSGLFESERFISLALEPVISGDQIRFVLDQSNQRRN
jgi:TP901 family phage tail tape measure protein